MSSSQSLVVFGSFNEDCSCLAVTSPTDGFLVFSSEPVSLKLRCEVGPLLMVHMWQRSNIFFIVRKAEPDIVVLWNEATKSPYAQLHFPSKVRRIAVTGERFAVVTDLAIHVHRVLPPEQLCVIETRPDIPGIVALAISGNTAAVNRSKNTDVIVVGPDGCAITNITAHNHGVGCIALSVDGSLLATTSERGTVVHVYDITSVPPIFKELRRSTTAGRTTHLTFSRDNTTLAACGDYGVVTWCLCSPSSNSKSILSALGSVVPYFGSEFPYALYSPPDMAGVGITCEFGKKSEILHVFYASGILQTLKAVNDGFDLLKNTSLL